MSVAASVQAAESSSEEVTDSVASSDGAEGTPEAQDAAGGGEAAENGEESAGASEEAESPQGAPEEYAAFTVEDGWELDDQRLAEVLELFKADDLPQDRAQAYMDQWMGNAKQLIEATSEQIASEQAATDEAALKQWDEEVSSDPVFGGERLEQTRTEVASFIKLFGDGEGGKDTQEALVATGLINYPTLVRMLSKAGAHFGEGTATGQAGMSAEGGRRGQFEHEVMYDKKGQPRSYEEWR